MRRIILAGVIGVLGGLGASTQALAQAAGEIDPDPRVRELRAALAGLPVSERQQLVGLIELQGDTAHVEPLGLLVRGFGVEGTMVVSPSNCAVKAYYAFKESRGGGRVQQRTVTTRSGQTRNLNFPNANFTGNGVLMLNSVTTDECLIGLILNLK